MADHLFESIFGKDTDIYSLEEITESYPAFSLAHFYLFKKTETGNKDFERRAALAGLYAENPLLLKTRLQQSDSFSEETIHPSEEYEPLNNDTEFKDDPAAHQPAEIEETGKETETRDNENQQEEKPDLQDVIQQPGVTANTALFEPLHTTDYFASLGIKLSEEQKSGDKLGKQLRSFTDWLKTMKKVHDSTSGGVTPEDTTVRIIAENSNRNEEVVTETMAEVLAEQGKHQKAIDIYQKLSLINPAKSAYFASKIDLLKEK